MYRDVEKSMFVNLNAFIKCLDAEFACRLVNDVSKDADFISKHLIRPVSVSHLCKSQSSDCHFID